MILKGFKRNSNKKFLNKLVEARKYFNDNFEIKTLGVIVYTSEFDDFKAFNNLAKEITVGVDKFKIIAYNTKTESPIWDALYGPKDFGWNGDIKNTDLNGFLNTEFDLLISYYKADVLELKIMTAKSNSKFKIGILQTDNRLNDIIIKTGQFNLFVTELKKYLTILKISNK